MGLRPRRIDLTTRISGVSYAEAAAGAVARRLAGLDLRFLGPRELVRNTRASGRTRDLLDVALLVEAGVIEERVGARRPRRGRRRSHP